MFEVIQSLSDSLYRRVCVLRERVVGVRNRRALVHHECFFWERNAAEKLHHRPKKRPPVTTSVKRIFSTQRLRHTQSQANAAGLSNVSLLASLKTDGIKVLIASLPANCPSASILSGSIISSFLLAHVETPPSLVAVPFRSRQSNPTLRQKQRAVPPHWCWRRRLRCIS